MERIGTHEITEWRDRGGELLGAAVFLSPDEVRTLRNGGTVEIRAEE